MAADDRVILTGSERSVPSEARVVGPADPAERGTVTVLLRSRSQAGEGAEHAHAASTSFPQRMERAQWAETHGADPADVARLEAFAHAHDLDIVEVSMARRSVVLSGTMAALSGAFGAELSRYEAGGQVFRGRTGPLSLPADVAPLVQGVFGLDDRPQARPQFRLLERQAGVAWPHAGAQISYTPPQLAQIYDFPTGLDGKGQCIALIELGGGYRGADIDAYFSTLNLPVPAISAVSVDGGHNQPAGTPTSADGEVLLDIEVAGGIAPGARLAVYFAPNTDRGFLDAVTTAIHDTVRQPTALSISWGSPESAWTAQALQAFDTAFQEAATLGVTVCCAAGDNGSSDGVNDGLAHVDFPASSPHVLACGGTRLEATNRTISSEVVWQEASGGAGGGGISDVFALPQWQQGATVPPSANPGGHVGRGVPDVAGDADPVTGYQVQVDGQQLIIGGTSAVAPLWAGLVALLNQGLGRPAGFLNPLLYNNTGPGGAFHDIVSGSNGMYQAGPGWDACTGWGSPDGAALLRLLQSLPGTTGVPGGDTGRS